ncbi:MAG: methyltransferase family protein [Dehalococcoidia bacterium]
MLFYIGLGIWIVLAVYCLVGIKKAYDKGETWPRHVSIAIWPMDTVHFLLVTWASLYSVWLLPINKMVALIGGLVVFGTGIVIMLAGMVEFRSFRRISGMNTSRLVATGIYQWSRNPQYIGWFLWLLGIALMGRSGLAFLFTMVFIIGMHFYTIWLEEPYLERIFGEEYRWYKSRTARYIGRPKR